MRAYPFIDDEGSGEQESRATTFSEETFLIIRSQIEVASDMIRSLSQNEFLTDR